MKRFLSAGEGYAQKSLAYKLKLHITRYIGLPAFYRFGRLAYPSWGPKVTGIQVLVALLKSSASCNFSFLRTSCIYLGLFFMCLQAGAMESAPTPTDRAVPVASTVHISTANSHRQIQQQTTLTGMVVDTAGRAIEGATIAVKGTRMQVMTDGDGRFSLHTTVTSGTLVASFMGYQSVDKRFETDHTGPFRFVLLPIDHVLEEVEINAGYYTVKDRERTGSISRITAEEIARQPVTNPMAAMIGRMPGVDVVQTNGAPGGGFTIQIRGRNSLRNDGNDPLYIIDGVPVPAEQRQSLLGNTIRPNSGPFSTLNPADIESIEILKDADATAIYGSRGANGVVLVTTKKGNTGKPVSRFSLSHGLGQVAATIPLLNTEQYLEMRREAFANDGKQPGPTDYDVNGTWDENRYTDWQKELMGGTAHLSNVRYSISGGEGRTGFLIGAGYSRETSVMPTDAADHKASTNFNINHRSADDRFSIQFSGNYGINNSNLPRLTPVKDALTLPPNAPALYDEEGNLNWENGTWTNPMAAFAQGYRSMTNTLIGNTLIAYTLFQGLQIKANLGYNEVGSKEHATQPRSSFSPFGSTGSSASFAQGHVVTWIAEPQVSFDSMIGLGSLSVLAGTTFQETLSKYQTMAVSGFSSDALLGNPQAGSSMNISSISDLQYRYHAIFGRINYNLLGRYIVNLTGRRDGSSRFGPGRQFANFGAVGVAWLFSKEPFISRHAGFLSHGKLRASYGLTGSDQIGDYGFYDTWSTATYPYGGLVPLRPTSLFNPDYGWEENRKLEFGLEMGLWKDRLQVEISYYENRSGNQLVASSLPFTTGFERIFMNWPAVVQNGGAELFLRSVNLSTGTFSWMTDIQFTMPKRKLLSFPEIEDTTYRLAYQVGKSMDLYPAYHMIGVDPQTGLYVFDDINGDGKFSPDGDYIAVKERGKRIYGGINNSFRFKRFSLDFLFQVVVQTGSDYTDIFNSAPGRMSNQPIYVMDRWNETGNRAGTQKFTSGPGDANTLFSMRSDHRIVDASFVRLKNISLQYDLPSFNHGRFTSAIMLTAQNLLLLTGYKGLDPESLSSDIPPLHMVTIGYKLNF